ncbi:hypothetical protein [Oceanivirga salmonicida]|uniref:hypothetical protein n=1 Tax=Oceanivirga salmonicida TaxID=1769291 RepID=UPI00082ADFAA|nr:hypothetical protein [Oceanivirga salmonicida]
MKKILTALSLFVAMNIFAHKHEGMKILNPTYYHSETAIVENIELGKTKDGDLGIKFNDFGVGVELEKNGSTYYTKDFWVRIKTIGEDKLVTDVVIPLFDMSLFNEKHNKNFVKGHAYHSFGGTLHLHVLVSNDKKTVEINHKKFNVVAKTEKDKTIYTEINGKFVFTTSVDKRGMIQAFGTLIFNNEYNKVDKMEKHDHMEKHNHEHGHEHKHDHEHEHHDHK